MDVLMNEIKEYYYYYYLVLQKGLIDHVDLIGSVVGGWWVINAFNFINFSGVIIIIQPSSTRSLSRFLYAIAALRRFFTLSLLQARFSSWTQCNANPDSKKALQSQFPSLPPPLQTARLLSSALSLLTLHTLPKRLHSPACDFGIGTRLESRIVHIIPYISWLT